MIDLFTPQPLPEAVNVSLARSGFRCAANRTASCAAMLLMSGQGDLSSDDQSDSLLKIGLLDRENDGAVAEMDFVDSWVVLSDPDTTARKIRRLVMRRFHQDPGGLKPEGWILLSGAGQIKALSHSLPIISRGQEIQLSPGSPMPAFDAAQVQDVWSQEGDGDRLVSISFRDRFPAVTQRRDRNRRFISALPGVMSLHDPHMAGRGMLELLVDFLGDRPVALLLGEDMETRFLHGVTEHRGIQLTELLSSYNVRNLLREVGAPLGDESLLVLPGAALRLGSFPVGSTGEDMPNLLVLLMRDPGDQPVGAIVVEYISDQLPDAGTVQLLENAVRYHAVAVRWHQALDRAGESIRAMEALIDNDPAGMLVLDETGRICKVNPALLALTGYRRDETVGRTLNRIFMPEQARQIQEMIRKSVTGNFETEIERKDAEPGPVRVRVYPYQQQDVTRQVIQLEDLSADHALLQKELEVERLQAVFSAAVAVHDKINTPLSIILAHLERLKYKWNAGLTWPDLEKSLLAVEKQVDRITDIIERMRDMKRYRVREYALRNVTVVDLSDSTDGEESDE